MTIVSNDGNLDRWVISEHVCLGFSSIYQSADLQNTELFKN
jgi:hypothetical protein